MPISGSEFKERTDPSAPAADRAVLYAKDNGAGKTQLAVRFPTGAVESIATEGGGGGTSEIFNVKEYGAVGDGVTDDRDAIRATVTAANGATVYFPPGTYIVGSDGILFSTSNIHLKGAGMFETTIKRKAGLTATPLAQSYDITRSCLIEDMTFDANSPNVTLAGTSSLTLADYGSMTMGPHIVRKCRFINTVSNAITVIRMPDVSIEDCIFQGDTATRAGTSVNVQESRNVRIRGNWMFYMYQGVIVQSGSRDVTIEDNYMDFGWWFTKAEYTNSGGTVTYSGTTLTDTAASFRTFTPYQTRVRALTSLRTASGGGVSYAANALTDSGANFTSLGIARGDIVRTATAFAIVASVPTSATTLQIERWLDKTTYEVLSANITAGTAYTVYRVATAMIETNTSTVLTIYWGGWRRLDGTATTPAAGTLYEVGYNTIYPIQVAEASDSRDVRVLNNTLLRSFGDMCEMQCPDYQVIGNTLYGGSDVGVACVGANGVVVGNKIDFIGSMGIYVGGRSQIIGNSVSNSSWFSTVDSNSTAEITVENDADESIITGNRLENTMGTFAPDAGRWGLAVRAENPYQSRDHVITGNFSKGHGQAEFRFYAVGGGGGRLRFRDNQGSISIALPQNWTFSPSEVNVKDFGATGDGTTDDTAAFSAAVTVAGNNGTVFIPPGTYILTDWTPTLPSGSIHIRGAGMPATGWGDANGGTILKAGSSAVWVMKLLGNSNIVQSCTIRDLRIDGINTKKGVTLNSGANTYGVQGVHFTDVEFAHCTVGVKLDTCATTQNDKNTFTHCRWVEMPAAGVGLELADSNADSILILGGHMSATSGSGTKGVKFTLGGNVTWISGQMGGVDTSFSFEGVCEQLTLIDFIDEAGLVSLSGPSNWPSYGVFLEYAVLTGSTAVANMGQGSALLNAKQSVFAAGNIRSLASDTHFMDEFCTFVSGSTWDIVSGTNARRTQIDTNGIHRYFNDDTTPVQHEYITGEIHGKLATSTKAGAPGDGDYYFNKDGMTAVDTSTDRFYFRTNSVWKSVYQPKSFAHGSLPTVLAYNLGDQVYCTTDALPLWSDGTNWREADGTVH